MDGPVKFGLIGYGAWGQCHARAIAETNGTELVAICVKSDSSRDKAKADFPGIAVYADYRELVAREDIDAVDIVLPTFLHYEVALAALELGKHLLLEKPMALTQEHCRELMDTATAKGLTLAIGHELRLSSQWGRIRSLIEEDAIGSPQYALVELSRKPYRPGADGWRSDIARVGNWILEEPIHFFDLARWYLSEHGNPVSVSGAANSIHADNQELQDNFSAILKWKGGAYAVVSQTLAAFEHHQTVKVTGTKGAIWAGWSGALDRTDRPTCFLKYFDGEIVHDLELEKQSGEIFELRSEIEMMVRCIQSGDSPVASAEDGYWSVAMCLAAQASVDQGKPIEFDSFLQSQ